MKVLEPGHIYWMEEYPYDAGDPPLGGAQPAIFFKKVGDGFPGNAPPPHTGTNCQELLRVLIDRIQYLDNQIPCEQNKKILANLRDSIYQLEWRAAIRHGTELEFDDPIELEPTCKICGHIRCRRHTVAETSCA